MVTWIIIGITTALSVLAFNNEKIMRKMQFNAAQIIHQRQYYRLISHAFIHIGWTHLIVNMMVLYFFGRAVEDYFSYFFFNKAVIYFITLYFGGMLVSNIWGLIKHHNNYYYNAVGASGAVSAVLFTFIFLNPREKLYLFAIVPIPGILFGIGYLFYSYLMSKRQSDNVAHDAHFLGAIFGFLFPVILKPSLIGHFTDQLLSFF
ncbi:MAG: rhomboid family intramembrane serine protease [Bacteroidales bacterium]|nr:rhomboid family intramembrane serine protease [Bacteroidales bacterium]